MLETGETWNPTDLASIETPIQDRIKYTKNNFNQSFLIDIYLKVRIVRTDSSMVPNDIVEMSSDPYQGPVLPLN